MMFWCRWVSFLACTLVGNAALAVEQPPHLGPSGQEEYRQYTEAPDHRAFAIAPGGTWGWASNKGTPEDAQDEALGICQGQSGQRCVLYAVNQRKVLDNAAWSRLWRPYLSARQAEKLPTGIARDQRMHDLSYIDARGKPATLSALRGKIVVLHFWGSWCPPCRREMPDLQKTYQRLKKQDDVSFVILQAREAFAASKQWATAEGIQLPLADSMSRAEDDALFRLANGQPIKDREVASRFPTTYVLDRHGVVVFAHVGPIHDWSEYEPFLRDLADATRSAGSAAR